VAEGVGEHAGRAWASVPGTARRGRAQRGDRGVDERALGERGEAWASVGGRREADMYAVHACMSLYAISRGAKRRAIFFKVAFHGNY